MRNMEEDDAMGMYEAGEEKSIVMRVPKPMPPPKGRVLPSSIELRLLEMQRKLSAIAEIPKILSSTLATVSQSFGSLSVDEDEQQQLRHMQRKCSYDEDALDYELLEQLASGDEETDEEDVEEEEDDEEDAEQEDDLVQVPPDDDVAKQLKDLTPESDYASEVNYATNELSDEPDNDNDNDKEMEMENDDDLAAHKTVYYMKLPAVASSEEEDDGDNEEDEDDSDFLSTTYTWNLRNVPKVRINEGDVSPQLELKPENAIDTSKVRAATPTPTPTAMPTGTPTCKLEAPVEATIASPTESQKLLFKLDNLERSWPWADREKIIYKQSTCHLVPRKPLGIVGQRIQLLAKQELLHKDKTQ
ncbi:glutamic acid-rich protein isoform X2 [Drosophila montana]